MTADRWAQVVRLQVGLGRLLPLGGPQDGAWIAEVAAGAVLGRAAADGVPGVRLGALRIGPAGPEAADEPVVPAPPSALWPGALRVTADFAATASEPLPSVASRLRLALAAAATEQLGLVVTEVDLRVTDLLEAPGQAAAAVRPPEPPPAREPGDQEEAAVARAALGVPGVLRLTGSLGGLGRAVHIEERGGDTALPHRHVRVEIATGTDRRAVDVARQVRAAVRDALRDRPTVAVLVTAVG
ncbi:nucleopolyhedrovirus P10 family protein [Streptomyces sp. Caat 7-52]|uniref:nucleopolyhedrovirus P10 family protein n=1 Tax=Streptomyces sp. Caat 7-52 TaxID=2949637 RepID=UPI002034E2E6|nr:nucleopolyhedrovirus P10 family protein [Streptomyces sp. Caat 7-52]